MLGPGAKIAARYTIERELGRGGMGSVFLARDEKFGEPVALKVALASGIAYDEFKDRFFREARLGNRLGRTEGFVRAFDWGEMEGSALYLAMDLVRDARPLDLATGTLEERLARVQEAARLVAVAHKRGVIHRDLKPANLLRDAEGTLWLSDFGLAKVQGEHDVVAEALERTGGLTRTGIGMGTPAFMPPEQFEDTRSVDERADVYALGVMLFVALAGRLPFEGTPTAISRRQDRVRDGREPMPRPRTYDPTVPEALDRLCVSAIALERAERLASAEALRAGIAAAFAARSASERDPGPPADARAATVELPAPGPEPVSGSSASPVPQLSPDLSLPAPTPTPTPPPTPTPAEAPATLAHALARAALLALLVSLGLVLAAFGEGGREIANAGLAWLIAFPFFAAPLIVEVTARPWPPGWRRDLRAASATASAGALTAVGALAAVYLVAASGSTDSGSRMIAELLARASEHPPATAFLLFAVGAPCVSLAFGRLRRLSLARQLVIATGVAALLCVPALLDDTIDQIPVAVPFACAVAALLLPPIHALGDALEPRLGRTIAEPAASAASIAPVEPGSWKVMPVVTVAGATLLLEDVAIFWLGTEAPVATGLFVAGAIVSALAIARALVAGRRHEQGRGWIFYTALPVAIVPILALVALADALAAESIFKGSDLETLRAGITLLDMGLVGVPSLVVALLVRSRAPKRVTPAR